MFRFNPTWDDPMMNSSLARMARKPRLEKIPEMRTAMESSPFRDLEDFEELMHNLRPDDVPRHPADEKTAATFLVVGGLR